MKRITPILLLIIFSTAFLSAQTPKRELRASWLATVWRLDWPSLTVSADASEDVRQNEINKQKNELISILDNLQTANMNAVFFQVRPMSDALYRSSYEPWSQSISSRRGADPGYDPLEFAIEEAHKRGIELHAWINPYRYSTSSDTHGNLSTDYAAARPSWLLDYGSYVKILNPGVPQVIQRITDIVEEIITKYEVDGIVFDDYFYVNGSTTNAMDQAQFDSNNPDNLERADWRRQNCNKMIASVYNKIQELKPHVIFGVSPAGVAASSKAVADKYGVSPSPGSDWQYNGIYSDPLAWLSEGTLDYISPQIYWTGTTYANLAPWWSNVANKFGKHFYSSHSLSDMSTTVAASAEMKSVMLQGEEIPVEGLSAIERMSVLQKQQSTMQRAMAAFPFSELKTQVEWNRNTDMNGAPGSVFYSTKKTVGSNFINYLGTDVFAQAALPPAVGWKPAEKQGLVENIVLSGQNLSWTYASDVVRYAVYAVPNDKRNELSVFSSSSYLLGISYTKNYTLPASVNSNTHKIAISVLDFYGNEYAPRVLGENTTTSVAPQLVYPANDSKVIIPAIFRWNEVSGADSYFWELAEDAQFNNMICSRETTESQFYSGLQSNMADNTTYYWRIRTRKANAESTYSDVWLFSGDKFKIISPNSGDQSVSLTPRIEWGEVSAATSYVLEISKSAQFTSAQEVYRAETQTNVHTVPANTLSPNVSYYVRVTATGSGFEAVSESSYFTTENLPVPVAEIISPANGATIKGTQIELVWKEQNAVGFTAELSESSSFPTRNTTRKNTGAFVYNAVFTDLKADTYYYLRVKALSSAETIAPSEPIMVYLTTATQLAQVDADEFCYSYYDAAGHCHVAIFSTEALPASISIYSVAGVLLNKIVYPLQMGNNTFSPDMESYSSGLYLMKIEFGGKKRTIKIKK